MPDRILSQNEIDNVFRKVRDPEAEKNLKKAQLYDYRKPERVAKDQLQSMHLAHENFVRSVASSLSGFLRSHIVAAFISVEQLSFADFARSLPTPSCLMALGVHPYDETAVLQIDRTLIFVILEMLLGGNNKSTMKIDRDLTEIERGILDSLFRIILQDLRTAWMSIAPVDFFVQSHVSENQLLQILPQDEAMIVVSMELRVVENSGLMHLAFPSILVKSFREKTGLQTNSRRRREATETDHARVLQRIRKATVDIEARLTGPKLRLDSLMSLQVGDILALDHAVTKELELMINGKSKFLGHIVAAGSKLGFQISAQPQN
jgi:flagellar motor switch protein FliM